MKHAPCDHENGYCAMGNQVRVEDYLWVPRDKTYVTLIASNHPEFSRLSSVMPSDMDVTILVEAATYPGHNYTHMYKPIAAVVRYLRTPGGPDAILINSEEVDLEVGDNRNFESDFIELCLDAAVLMKVGQGYFNDPDAS